MVSSSVCLYFSNSMSFKKQISTVVLEGYLYAGTSCMSCVGLIFFWCEPFFGLDICCLCPQHVPAIILLIRVMQVHGLLPHSQQGKAVVGSQYGSLSVGSWLHILWGGRGSGWCCTVGLSAAAMSHQGYTLGKVGAGTCTCLQDAWWWQWFAAASGV